VDLDQRFVDEFHDLNHAAARRLKCFAGRRAPQSNAAGGLLSDVIRN